MEIKIQSTQLIKPSKSTPESRQKFKLSFLDQLAPFSYIDLILYYKPSGDQVNIPDRCGQLVNSLSDVLTLFYPLAGRLAENGLEVDCRDQGVKYVETRVSTSLDAFLEQDPKIDHFSQLVGAPDQATNMLLYVQINVFDCGSLVIGVTASHKVTDGWNLVRFINEWASENRKGCNTSNGAFSPCFNNLASLFPPRVISSFDQHSPVTNDHHEQPIILTKRFVFKANAITKLRKKADNSEERKHSRVTLVGSLIWKAMIAIDQVKSGRLRDCLLGPAMNLRGKVGSIPISESSLFGNVWAPYLIWFLVNKTEPKFVDLVGLIEDTTRNTMMQISTSSCEEIGTQAMANYAEVYEEVRQNKFAIFSSWCRFPVYEADFGWGKPWWASVAGSSLEKVLLMDGKYGDGIEAWVSLEEKYMNLFEQDEDILTFTLM